MTSLIPRWRLRAKTFITAAAASLALLGMPAAAHADDGSTPPTLTDGSGLTQVGAATGTATNFVITVTTPQVAGQHHIKIILPSDYNANPTKRYPVLYFLHGAADDPIYQTYPALSESNKMITVIPDGGHRGWYSNWRDQNTVLGAQNWENFHLDQVIPFVDANLRTVATKQGRAVAGISMGGFGALHYAEDRPELFSQVASFSGDVDLSVDSMDLRLAAVASLTNAPGGFCDTGDCTGSYAPGVSSDALFGSPYPVFNADQLWNDADPTAHVGKLAGLGISIYTGSGRSPVGFEFWVEGANKHLRDHLDALNMPYYYQDYGNGTGWGTQCDGEHNAGCWAQDLVDYIPRLEQAFAAS
ncbi:alpha/beta hydrolase [Kitasatospora kifunensis]|uniref:S-formylglutathione hydrolase FrmB n=1 Tax=Kitasatospora kifunensis TaxID=58351 RepID=A0A7W7VTR9_KITKI|nr:alpha/beta hydrolase family protein [Kitasatospora kifunensis]MBB4922606.1 S-formylglutathione hydrolase FrmB [Kitasatospora kifunensis]